MDAAIAAAETLEIPQALKTYPRGREVIEGAKRLKKSLTAESKRTAELTEWADALKDSSQLTAESVADIEEQVFAIKGSTEASA